MSDKFKTDYQNKNVLVLGLARSGLAAMDLLLKKGANLIAADENRDISMPGRFKDINIHLGPFSADLLDSCDEVILSPGISTSHQIVLEAVNRSIPIVSELELGYRFAEGKIIALTGTNGKSTTVKMIERILIESGHKAIAAGNIGKPFSMVTEDLDSKGVFVIEVSSFQLELISDFKPDVTGILNMTPDHLDRYPTAADYYRAKERITANNDAGDCFFYNADDERCAMAASKFTGSVVAFSSSTHLNEGIFLDGSTIVRASDEKSPEEIMDVSDLKVVGLHNVENALAAIASLNVFGVPAKSCREALSNFEGLDHRMEKVRTVENVVYFNDSKATNVEATVKSLAHLECPVVLIAGGLDKGGDFKKLQRVAGNILHVVLIGSAADLIEEALCGIVPVSRAETMTEAVQKARDVSVGGACVVLSPACASFDMFTDFRERGNLFKDIVNQIGV
ncbi:MAG: UDP-N-acetylmuramoyl-L-alanine--D-glutamate ligase [Candidatus Krumholzibacteriota bacterium]|nr:UDP-N-acetylmuramoyl-L-alanine--D-glutamate ligase [Candidatus Krumholzibacteriota bacterium]